MTIPLASIPVEDYDGVVAALNSRALMIYHMSRTYFALAWADYQDEYGGGVGAGVQIMDVMPDEIDPAALKEAYELADAIEKQVGSDLAEILMTAKLSAEAAENPCNEEYLGHYLVMQSLGHGVGIEEVGLPHDWMDVPCTDFGYYDLDPEKYPIPDDNA